MSNIDEIISSKPDKPIFHYTSQQGLIGILTERKIWASKIHYMNDSEEFSYAFQILLDKLNHANVEYELKDRIESAVNAHRGLNIFVASFSEEGDLLSQWRAYCPEVGGFSIGFTYEYLEPALQRQNFLIARCEYSRDKQEKMIDELLDKSLNALRRVEPGQWQYLTRDFILLASIFKHPSFSEEREWRIVSRSGMRYSHKGIKYRPGRSMIIPYFEFELAETPSEFSFDKIYVGPTPHKDLSRDSVRGLLVKVGATENINRFWSAVECSQIPYRAW